MKAISVRLAALLGVCIGLVLPSLAWSQTPGIEQLKSGAVGLALWYSYADVTLDAAPGSASSQVKGYTNVLPNTISEEGPSFGISYGSWGFNIGFNQGSAKINKFADLNQNGLPNTYTFVVSAARTTRTATLLFRPLKWLYVGYGHEDGTIEFSEVSPAGVGQTNKLGFGNDFYSFGLAAGFDPTKNKAGPVVTVFTKIPAARSEFTGSAVGAGLGIYF